MYCPVSFPDSVLNIVTRQFFRESIPLRFFISEGNPVHSLGTRLRASAVFPPIGFELIQEFPCIDLTDPEFKWCTTQGTCTHLARLCYPFYMSKATRQKTRVGHGYFGTFPTM
jgi:hypothetical protein